MIRSLLSAAVLLCAAVLGPVARASPAPYVTRHGSALSLGGHALRFGAANIYWLGLDENVGVDPAALASRDVDIVEVHYYPPTAEKVAADAATVTGAGKVYFAGEYGSTSAEPALMSAMAADRNVTGAAFWSLFAHGDDHGYVQHDDGFTLHYPGDDADMRRHADAIRAFGLAMAGRSTPVPAPGRPQITHLTRSGATVTVTWRGATTAGAYTIQRAARAFGPWTTVCGRCATDTTGTWTGTAGPGRYRVVPFTLAGTRGPASPVVRLT
jgi:mannan endo-1,4-beta-mannosidase